MHLINHPCGCIAENDARELVACCDHAQRCELFYELIGREALVARVERWIAVAPSIAAMMDRVQAAAYAGIEGSELLAAQLARLGIA